MLTLTITDGIAEIRLERPPVNALDGAMLDALSDALDRIEAQSPPVVLLTSATKCFCAGADLAMIQSLFAAPDPAVAMAAYVDRLHAVFDRLERLPAVTVAVIAGPALGGGLELALACDLRFAAEEAMLGLPEAAVGLLPGAGGTQRLTRLCGPGVAARIVLGAERINGTEALRLGLAQYTAPRASLPDEARALAARIAALAPASLRASKALIAQAGALGRAGFENEKTAVTSLMRLPETRARIEAFFARQP